MVWNPEIPMTSVLSDPCPSSLPIPSSLNTDALGGLLPPLQQNYGKADVHSGRVHRDRFQSFLAKFTIGSSTSDMGRRVAGLPEQGRVGKKPRGGRGSSLMCVEKAVELDVSCADVRGADGGKRFPARPCGPPTDGTPRNVRWL